MGKSLYIAEKPSVAQEFAKALKLSTRRKDGYLEGEEDVPDGEPLDPDADEFYPEDLVGFGVMVDEAGEGIVTGFIDGENPLFLLSLDGKSVYVPVADEFITEIDVAGRKIRMQLPEGLIDLND